MMGQVENGRLYRPASRIPKQSNQKHLQAKSLHNSIVKHGTLKVVLVFLKVKLQGVYERSTYQTTSLIYITKKL